MIRPFRPVRPAVVEWTLVPLVALAASVAALGAVLRPGRAYVGIDTLGIHVPFRTFVYSAGGLPLWNPDVLLGAPFLANGDAAELYPLSSLFFLGSPARLYGVQIALHLALCAVTTYAFVRVSLRASPAGAAVAAVLFSFNGYVLVHLTFLSFVYSQPWVPLLFLAVERTVTRGLRWAWLGVLPVAFSLLGGNPQELYESALWVPPLAVVAAMAGGVGWRGVVRGLGGAAASFAGGLAVAAVQVLPQAQLVGDTSRGGRGLTFAEVSRYPLPAIPVWRVLLPDYGRPSIGENAAWIGLVGLLLVVV
ncbi:MAG TPA: hypothetical protein VKP11_09375, partial [Frankiaceae bacterium]|nr:hypothetical protein [Frankiaceae bacterium]